MKANAGGMSYKQVESIQKWILLLPGVLLYGIFNFIPIIGLIILSMFEYYGFGGAPKFVGFQNFSELFFNEFIREEFILALTNNFIFFGLIIVSLLSIGTLFALLLSFKTKGSAFYKALFFLPYPLAGAAVAFMMQKMFGLEGPINYVLEESFDAEKIVFLSTQSDFGLATLSFFYIWHRLGFAMIMILSAILAVRTDLLEAAFLDGASRWQAIKNIVFPVLAPAFIIVTVIIMVDTFNNADYQILLFGDDPGKTDVMGSYLYRMSFGGDGAKGYGFGAAVGLVTAIIILPAAMYSALKNIKG